MQLWILLTSPNDRFLSSLGGGGGGVYDFLFPAWI